MYKRQLQYWVGNEWKPVPQAVAGSEKPSGGRPYRLEFPQIHTSKVRVVLTHEPGKSSALTEVMAWGPSAGTYTPPRPPEGNFAYNGDPGAGFPKASASFSDQFGGVPEKAIDGKIIFPSNPSNRWTSYGSPNKERDWLELDFGKPQQIGRVVLHIFDDFGGVRAPKSLTIEGWNGKEWTKVEEVKAMPEKPKGGMANTLRFTPLESTKLRINFEHIGQGDSRSGVTEIEVWKD